MTDTSKSGARVGYVVSDEYGLFQEDGDGILWRPSYRGAATVFSTRARAKAAIARSIRYAKREGFDWDCDYDITRLEMQVRHD